MTERLYVPIDRILGIPNDLIDLSSDYQKEKIAFRDSMLEGLDPKVTMGREKAVRDAINHGLIPHNFTFGEKFIYNSIAYWSPLRTTDILIAGGWKYWKARSALGNIVNMLSYGILLPFMIIGVFKCWKNNVFELKMLSLASLVHNLLHVIMISGSGRYRQPVDFMIILLAFYGLMHTMDWFEKM